MKSYKLYIGGKLQKYQITANVKIEDNRKVLTLGSSIRFINKTEKAMCLSFYHNKQRTNILLDQEDN